MKKARIVFGTFAFAAILAACNAGHSVSTVFPAAQPARRDGTLEHPRALHFVPFAVTNTGSNSVTFYKPGSAKVTARIADGVNLPKTAIFDGSGNLYVANARTVTVYASGSSHAKHTIESNVNAPAALAVNGGNLYVANQGNNTVAVFSPAGVHLATISRGINVPDAMAFDRSGNLYVSNRGPASGASSSVTVYAPGKTAPLRTIAQNVKLPLAIALDSANNVYVANVGTNDVTVYKAGTATLSRTISQGILVPSALTFDPAGNLYVASLVLNYVTMYKPGQSSVALKISQHIDYPIALAYKDGVLYVSNLRGNAVTAYAPGGSGYLRAVSKGMSQPSAVALAPNDATFTGSPTPSPTPAPQMLFISDPVPNKIDAYTLPLGNSNTPAFTITKGVYEPYQLLFDSVGNLLVFNLGSSQPYSNGLVEFAPPYTGSPTTLSNTVNTAIALSFARDGNGDLFTATCSQPGMEEILPPYTGAVVPISFNNDLAAACWGIATDASGDVFVQDWNSFGSGDVREYQPPISTNSLPVVSIPAIDATPGPEYLAVNHAGDLFVASPKKGEIDVYAPPYTGVPIAKIPSGNPGAPAFSMAFDANDDLFFVTYSPVTEIAPPYTGKPLAKWSSGMTGPIAVTMSSAGNLYVYNHAQQYGNENYILEFSPPFTNNSQPSGFVGGFSNLCCTNQIMALSP